MLDDACFCPLQHLHAQQGLNASQSANDVSLDPRTVASWLAQEHVRPRQPSTRHSTRDPLQQDMVRRLERYPSAAAQGCQRRREHGFDGGSASVTASGRPVRPRRQPACLTLACAPGECAQVDWGACGSVQGGQTQRRRRVFVLVLCSSRMMSVEGTVSQTMEHFLACHQHACECFGGLPNHVMVDNRTSAVRKRALGDAPVLQPKSRDVATHNGCPIAPCHVGKGHEQGRVEHGVGSVTKPCLAGLAIPDCSALHPAARQWLETGAHGRLHGATRDTPTALGHTERPSLRPLPRHPCASATVSQGRASRQCRMTLEPNRSAVPAHDAGHALTRTTDPDRRCLSLGDHRMARHTRRDARFQDVEDPAHPRPLLEQRKQARDQQLCRRFLARSPRAEAYDLTREERRLHPHHHVRTIVALSEIYDPQAVARAMEDALVYEAFSSESSANLVEQRARFTPEASACHLTRRDDLLEVRRAQPDLRL